MIHLRDIYYLDNPNIIYDNYFFLYFLIYSHQHWQNNIDHKTIVI